MGKIKKKKTNGEGNVNPDKIKTLEQNENMENLQFSMGNN